MEDKCSLQVCLTNLQSKIDETEVNYFNVNRRRLLEGAIRGAKRKSFRENGRLNVKFSDNEGKSEGGIDQGGPTREFLRLALQSVSSCRIFAGNGNSKYIMKCQSGRSFVPLILFLLRKCF